MSDIDFVVDANNIKEAKMLSDQAIKIALEQCGALWETDAKKITPVDTGRLRNSIEHHQEGDDTMVVQTNVEYAIYVHEGARGRRGRPFIRASGQQDVQRFKQIIEKELKR